MQMIIEGTNVEMQPLQITEVIILENMTSILLEISKIKGIR